MSQLNEYVSQGRTVKTALLDGAERNVVVSFGEGEAVLTTSDGSSLKTAEGDIILTSSATEAEAHSGVMQSGSLKLNRKLCSKEDLAFGECNPAQFSVDIYDIDDVAGKEIVVYELIEGHRVNIFSGKVDSSKLNPEQNYRSIVAYDALYEAKLVDVKLWYDSYFASTQKEEYKGPWGLSQYYYPHVVKYNDEYYQYINTQTDEFIRKDGQNEFIENVAQYLTGKTPEEILANSTISKYISKLQAYDPYNYTPVPLKQFRDDLFEFVGIEQVSTNLVCDNVRINKTIVAESILFGTLIQNICQMCGVFGVMTPTGKFRYVDLRDEWQSQEVIFPSGEVRHYYGGVETVDYSDNYVSNNTTYEEFTTDLIDSVKIFNADNTMVSYAGALNSSNSLDIVGNLLLVGMDGAVLDVVSQNIFNLVKTLTYTPLRLSAKVSLPIDLGSFVTFTSHTGQTVKSLVLSDDWSNAQMVDQAIASSGGKKRKDSSKVSNDLQKAIKNTLDVALVDIYERINSNGAMIKRLDANSGSYMVEVKRRDEGVESRFEQTANKVSWIIKSGTSESNFTLTDRMAALMAQTIDISGLVTFKNAVETGTETVINGGSIKTDTIQGNALRMGSITADKLAMASGQNLLCDVDSFETVIDAAAYSKVSSSIITVSITSDESYIGRNSLKVAKKANNATSAEFTLGNTSYFTGRVPIDREKYYGVSFYAKVTTASTVGFYPEFFPDSVSTQKRRGALNAFNIEADGDWHRVYGVVDTHGLSATFNALGLAFYVRGNTGASDFYIDCIQIEEFEATNQLPSKFRAGSLTTIDGACIYTGSITANQLATDAIKSRNYVAGTGRNNKYAASGSFLDLSTGKITTPAFYIDENGVAGFKGDVVASSLTAVTKGKLAQFDFDADGLRAKIGGSSRNNLELSKDKLIYECRYGTGYNNVVGAIEINNATFSPGGNIPSQTIGVAKLSGAAVSIEAKDFTYIKTNGYLSLFCGQGYYDNLEAVKVGQNFVTFGNNPGSITMGASWNSDLLINCPTWVRNGLRANSFACPTVVVENMLQLRGYTLSPTTITVDGTTFKVVSWA